MPLSWRFFSFLLTLLRSTTTSSFTILLKNLNDSAGATSSYGCSTCVDVSSRRRVDSS
ncbi:hypothetical protein PF008_g28645 [Phytophthora fragariae]|uniref:Secreted protein n=2 Tax=Phytophthora TaxID=4783 RepID=A0A6A3JEM6_9STRA|nr:hypothetical protein PR002_g21122 [Phytophthora rubi]KAE9278316.1 hypothetical protein PF008_g28645 [Phytophthora fragariae]